MAYPEELLPKVNYKAIPIKGVPDKSYLQRKSVKPYTIASLMPTKIRVDEVCKEHRDIFGLSCNLHGKFKVEYLKFEVDNKDSLGFTQLWKEGDAVYTAKQIKYTENVNYHAIFFDLFQIHDKAFPYIKQLPETEIVVENGKSQKKTVLKTTPFSGKVEVIHNPTRCNFWHFELRVTDQDGNEILRGKAPNWAKLAAGDHLELIVKQHGKREVPMDYKELAEQVYTKSA